MLWLPFVRRIGAGWLRVLIAFTVGLLAFLAVDAALEGLEIAADGAVGVRRRRARLPRRARRLPGARRRSTRYLRGRRERARAAAGAGGGLPGAAGRDRDRPAQPRRGPRDRLRLRVRGARARRLPGRRLRDPQHHRGPRDRRPARRRERPASARLAAPRPDRRRAGDPRRLDRRRRLQPEPRGAAVRRRRRRDRPGDRASSSPRCATSAGARPAPAARSPGCSPASSSST